MPNTRFKKQLLIILGDQLDPKHTYLQQLDPTETQVWMAEVSEESTKVWSHKARIAMFLSAMRHFAVHLKTQGWNLHYERLETDSPHKTFESALTQALKQYQPKCVLMLQAGEWQVQQTIERVCQEHDVPLEVKEDTHFMCTLEAFNRHADGRKQLRMAFFYQFMRQTHDILMQGKTPEGGQWSFDADNRQAFPKQGPPPHPQPKRFPADTITQEVLTLVNTRFAHHPGILNLETFDWPVTPQQAEEALEDFITHRLPSFGVFQDAMWQMPLNGEVTELPYLFHARLSAALNLKLLNPRHVIQSVITAYESGHVTLASTEGFIRQILGWREYVRGVYWRGMPEYLEQNAMGAEQPLPDFYWTGDTAMNCLAQSLKQTLTYGYAHHIQRLMVTGLFALLLRVNPQAVHAWYLAMYVDAVEWVELPNTLGMSQFADGGIMASKPYIATGKYIQRMSNYCTGCRYNPAEKIGDIACPFTTLYWDYLMRHEAVLAKNPRMSLQVKNLAKLSEADKASIQHQAQNLRTGYLTQSTS